MPIGLGPCPCSVPTGRITVSERRNASWASIHDMSCNRYLGMIEAPPRKLIRSGAPGRTGDVTVVLVMASRRHSPIHPGRQPPRLTPAEPPVVLVGQRKIDGEQAAHQQP